MKYLKVLIVEDNFVLAMMLEDILTSMGHVVLASVATEAAAVAAATDTMPDLMIVDAGLRAGTGAGTIASIRSRGFVPCVHMSGTPFGSSTAAPGTVFVQKPFSETELAAAIEAVTPSSALQ